MAYFILNRPDDYLSLSKKRIIGTTLKWFVILMVGAILLRIACVAIYMLMGVNPMELTKFGGDSTNYVGHATWKTVLKLMVIAPLAEEIMFRLGLSFKRRTVALWLGLLPVVCAYYMHKCHVWYILLGLAAVGVLIYWLIAVSLSMNSGRSGARSTSFPPCGFPPLGSDYCISGPFLY